MSVLWKSRLASVSLAVVGFFAVSEIAPLYGERRVSRNDSHKEIRHETLSDLFSSRADGLRRSDGELGPRRRTAGGYLGKITMGVHRS